MSSRLDHQPGGDSNKKSAEHSNACSRTQSNCDSRQSGLQHNQRKPADRSPASRGYPKECIGYSFTEN